MSEPGVGVPALGEDEQFGLGVFAGVISVAWSRVEDGPSLPESIGSGSCPIHGGVNGKDNESSFRGQLPASSFCFCCALVRDCSSSSWLMSSSCVFNASVTSASPPSLTN